MNIADWQESSTEANSEIYQGTLCEKKQQVWCGGMEKSNQQKLRYFKLQKSLFFNSELWGQFFFIKGLKTCIYETILSYYGWKILVFFF
jgi:hypothetical protein